MVLFLKPDDEKALKAVRKWEFLSADDFEDELFEMKPVFKSDKGKAERDAAPELKPLTSKNAAATGSGPAWRLREIERAVSLADAFTVRGQLFRALEILKKATLELGAHPELERRMELLSRRSRRDKAAPAPETRPQSHDDPRAVRRLKLETFLRRINERRLEG